MTSSMLYWLIGVVRYHVRELRVLPGRIVVGVGARRVLHVVQGQEPDQGPDLRHAGFLAVDREVGDTAPYRVRGRSSQVLVAHIFPCDRSDDVRAGDVHLADARDHEDKISEGRGVRRPSGRWPEDHRDLRHHPGGPHVLMEYGAVPAEAVNALLKSARRRSRSARRPARRRSSQGP